FDDARALDGCTRVGSPGCFAYCGGQGASANPAASCCSATSNSASKEPGSASIASNGSPIASKRSGTLVSVNAAGSQSGTSSQRSGVDTRASGIGRTEYTDATVRSLAFWL